MQILFLNRLNDYWQKQLPALEKKYPEVKFINNLSREENLKFLKTSDAVVCGRLSNEEINKASNLKAIFVPFTGLDNFPVQNILRRNIYISNTHANAKYVAEKAVSLALALLGRIVEFHRDLYKGKWNLFQLTHSNYWTTIQGKFCTILGYGEIGQNIAKFLKAYDCKIIGFKKHLNVKPPFADEVTDNLHEAINKGEIIFVCLPLTNKTKEIISKDVLKDMKGKYLINVGRGNLINEEGLYISLKDKILSGAAIDVWYNYPGKKRPEPVLPSKYPIHELNNIILSPHKSGLTKESIEAMIDDTVENIRVFLETGRPKNVVKDEY